MQDCKYKITAKVWLYPGLAAWHFITIPPKESKEITSHFSALKRGWGSLRVNVTIGETSWDTSIFPDQKRGGYLLPLKKEVRKKEKIINGDTLTFSLQIKL